MGALMGILVIPRRQLQPLPIRMGTVLAGIMERQVVVVPVPGMAQAQTRDEPVRSGNLLHRLQIGTSIHEGETPHAAIRARGLQPDLGGLPGVATQHLQPPARRHAVLADRQLDAAVASVDAPACGETLPAFLLEAPHPLATPGAPEHPQCDGHDHHGRGELEIGLDGFAIQVAAQVHAAQGDQPDHGGMRNRRGQAQQDGLFQGAAYGHDEGRHQGLGVPRLEAVQGPQEDGAGEVQPGMGRALLQQFGEAGHDAPGGDARDALRIFAVQSRPVRASSPGSVRVDLRGVQGDRLRLSAGR
ncbi:hypothetical protein FQZ97_850440 [compost metagenome]